MRTRTLWIALAGFGALLLSLLLALGGPRGSRALQPAQAGGELPVREVDAVPTSRSPAREPTAEEEAPEAADTREAFYRELGGDEWRGWTERTPPGVVAGRVLRGIAPVGGARVRLWPVSRSVRASEHVGPGVIETATDESGAFRFGGVPDGKYRVRADEGGERIEARVDVAAQRGGDRSVLLLFGRSVIEGVVYDDRAVLLPGVPVVVSGIGPQPGRAAYAHTDADGRFRLAGLIAGRYWVQVERKNEIDPADQHLVDLGVAARVEVVFGRSRHGVSWTSRLVDSRGEPIPGRRSLMLAHAERGDELRVWTEPDGSLELELEPGRWIAHLAQGLYRGPRIGEVLLEQGVETRDLVHDAARLFVELLPADPGLEADKLLEGARTRLALHAIPASGGPWRGEACGAGLQWLGLSPGRYEVRAEPPLRLVGGAEDAHVVTISEASEVRELRLSAGFE